MRIRRKELASLPLSPREPLRLAMQRGGITSTRSRVDLVSLTLGVLPVAGFYPPAWVVRAFFQDMTTFVTSMRFASSFSIPLVRSEVSSNPVCSNCSIAPWLLEVMVMRIPPCIPSLAGGPTRHRILISHGTRCRTTRPRPSSSRGLSCAGPRIPTLMTSTCLWMQLPLTSGTGRSL